MCGCVYGGGYMLERERQTDRERDSETKRERVVYTCVDINECGEPMLSFFFFIQYTSGTTTIYLI